MTDIVIPLSKRSGNNNLELLYCLRSIDTYLKGVGNVFLIGHCPEWVTNVIHIPKDDDSRNRFRDRNIMEKMLVACSDERVSKEFLMIHDDHFLLETVRASSFPYVHHGPMTPGPGQYGKTKGNTMAILGRNINDYDSHCPILFNKNMFKSAIAPVDWDKWYGYCLKTIYCVFNGIEGEYYPDLKIRYTSDMNVREMIKGRRWFSSSDRALHHNPLRDLLDELYPNKSKYESETKPIPGAKRAIHTGMDTNVSYPVAAV
jgi:hypothetical protein